MRFHSILTAASLVMASAAPGLAATYYVAPLDAKVSCAKADGSLKCPWLKVAEALANPKVIGGDTILLMDGAHGHVRTGEAFDKDVTVQSQNGSNAHLSSIHFSDLAMRIKLKNLKIWRNDADPQGFMIRSYKGSSFLTFENLDVRSRPDADKQLSWTADRWRAVEGVGMDLRGKNYTVRNCRVSAVRVGISAIGPGALVENNLVMDFTGDGIKSGGSNSTFRNNIIKNRFKIDKTHADGFQAYSPDVLTGLTIEANTILEWTHSRSHPLRGPLQGIGMFNGYYDNLLIQNNVIATRHFHGITVLGTRHARILNNTVVNIDGIVGKAPWIRIVGRSDTLPLQDVVVANNVAMQFHGKTDVANNVLFTDNSVILYPEKVMTDMAAFNYVPKATSGFIDTGNAAYAPKTDIMGTARPYGKGPDRGAYEQGSVIINDTSAIRTTSTSSTSSTGSNSTSAKFLKAP
jgi:hypothetical protein